MYSTHGSEVTKIDAFTPPWPFWNDQLVNKLDWKTTPPGDFISGRPGSGRQSSRKSVSRKSMSRKSVAKKSITGGKKKSIAGGGGRKSVAGSRKSVSGSRKSVASTGRKSVSRASGNNASASRKSVAKGGGRKSVAGGRKSVAGGRKSVAGGRKSVAGGRKSVAGGRKSVSGGSKSGSSGGQSVSMAPRKTVAPKKTFLGHKDGKKGDKRPADAEQEEEPLFVDPKGKEFMPKSLPVHKWERPCIVNPNIAYSLDIEPGPLDLWTPNRHLVKSKVMRHIISSVMCLETDGRANPFVKDCQTSTYIPNSGEFWNPRDHVYALTPVGEKTKHSPQYNNCGMYIIRLFFMGKWRRLVVDDSFPYDENGNLLLLRSRESKNIWMQLLTKGLLKVAALSWNSVDETFDFNVISLLTGWICNSIDVSLMTEEPIWKIIQGHCIEGKHSPERICDSVNPKTCIFDAMDIFLDKPKSRSVFVHLPEVMEETEHFFIPCFEGLAYVKTALNDEIPVCDPKWKNIRWVDWALDRGIIRGKPGTVRKILELFVPLKKGNHIFVETPSEVKEDVGDAFLVTHLPGYFKSDAYMYNKIYRHFRKLDIYYKRSYFEIEKIMDNVFVDLPKLMEKDKQIPAPANTFKDHFFLASDSPNCKNIFVTLTTLCEKNDTYGYIACEGYNWQSTSQGPIWFSIRTRGTRTHSINLGPGLQVCRFWYNLPCLNYISFHSRTQFYLTSKEEILNMQSVETASYMTYGADMAEIFSKLMKAPLGSVTQGECITKYIGAFCPPNLRFQNLPSPADPKGCLNIVKLEELFEEKVVELIMENEPDIDKCVQIIRGFQDFFLNPDFGEKALEKGQYPQYIPTLTKIKEVKQQLLQEFRDTKKAWINSIDKDEEATSDGKRSKSIKGNLGKKSIRRPSSKKSIRRQSAKKSTRRQSSKKSIRRQSAKKSIRRSSTKSTKGSTKGASTKGGGSSDKKKTDKSINDGKFSMYLLDGPKHNATLLRKMLKYEEDLLAAYPFRYDNDRKLCYYDYLGTSDATALSYQDWVPIVTMVINVHSDMYIPCGFILFSEVKNVHLDVYDLDTNIHIPFEYTPNNLIHLKQNANGYAVVVYKINEEAKAGEPVASAWRVRVYGVDRENVPHPCLITSKKVTEEKENELDEDPSKYNCRSEPGPHPLLVTQSVTGLYFPNPSSKICRFLIKVTRSVVISLGFSASNKDVKIRLNITGCYGKKIIELNGVGELIIPVIVLHFHDAELQQAGEGLERFYYFCGEVEVMFNSWPLKPKEAQILEESIKWKEEELAEKIISLKKKDSVAKSRQSVKSLQNKDTRSRRSSTSKDVTKPSTDGGPCWKIALYAEKEHSDCVKLVLDKRYEESFFKKKAAIWDVENPNRTETGRMLRQTFINSIGKGKENHEETTQTNEVVNSDAAVPPTKASKVSPPLPQDDNPQTTKRKSSSSSRKGSLKTRRKSGTTSLKNELIATDYLSSAKLLPPLIDKFSLQLPDEVIPIVVKLEPVPTRAPLRLGPFREEIPTPVEEILGELDTTKRDFYNEMPEAELSEISSGMNAITNASSTQTMKQEVFDQTYEFSYFSQKQAGDAAINLAYEERDKVIRELMQELEMIKTKKGVTGFGSKKSERRQSKKSIRRQSKKSMRRQSKKSIRRQSKKSIRRQSKK
ncbi:uncharacterized protein LOC106674107 isoform X2 [Cimex lectularius]|uniref:Calpain catalytic domain-containing protein n=1 Tax=Cimex lectularius TaxID=79782 RepID=A0A8I6STH5_CIMLE|nr:uncharacterized protein LOC106674107 isoform X2 [Cimex lectularius]